ncbi:MULTISPECIES: VOC family protein [Pantoea]|jgi:glyoxylase I family protein|uniref:VOC family protein n=1 Tax=Enterobacter agglomerans TaxID=549 RepID=A0ACC5PNZ4_ENTAG|nr:MULTISPECIES: VOC family protein [Pantoea]AYP24330.1 VOC family protein [Pantoea agglomerans]MBD8126590.1 VOC family protein [Pantoea agglomerans]MBD8153841.1 VOC family protein [Pantoea agglomerans]MBD8241998.1 VOC family protein [Pantoea agglomerans]MDK4217814.1 VOC family protein [Pantoea agglomerans]
MLQLTAIHHIAIIASDYQRSKAFYCDVLGFRLMGEYYREARESWKGDLALQDRYTIELFSFPEPPARVSHPEACGLRHLAFTVPDVAAAVATLADKGVICEPIRIDDLTGKQCTFFADPDGLPLELYQA